ncbi:MAG: hypothetical protein Tsb002_14200 [Wenzhouxiangellaceae bacterium]
MTLSYNVINPITSYLAGTAGFDATPAKGDTADGTNPDPEADKSQRTKPAITTVSG